MRILIVEDDHGISRPLGRLITLLDATVIVSIAETGVDGIKQGINFKPDFIFLDIMLPDINGVGVLEKLRALGSKAIIAMYTALQDNDYQKRCFDLGCNHYYIKSKVMIPELIEIIKTYGEKNGSIQSG